MASRVGRPNCSGDPPAAATLSKSEIVAPVCVSKVRPSSASVRPLKAARLPRHAFLKRVDSSARNIAIFMGGMIADLSFASLTDSTATMKPTTPS